jgi:hypothetical protein
MGTKSPYSFGPTSLSSSSTNETMNANLEAQEKMEKNLELWLYDII